MAGFSPFLFICWPGPVPRLPKVALVGLDTFEALLPAAPISKLIINNKLTLLASSIFDTILRGVLALTLI